MGALVFLGVALAASPAVALAQDAAPATVFLDVSVLTMLDDTALHHQAVVVERGTIAWVGPVADLGNLGLAENVRVIAGAGRFLLPGLADMHVHMSALDVPLFLANGVTTVRELNGSAAHLALRDSIAGGLRVGPRMSVASTLLTGAEQPWRHELVRGPDAAARIARSAVDQGFDALKVYDGLSAASYTALVEVAVATGLPLVGHVPRDVGLEAALAAGQRGIEHTEQIMYASVGHQPAPARIPGIAAAVAASGAWVTPTLASQRILAQRGTSAYDALFDAPEVRFVADGILAWWRTLRTPDGARAPAPDDPRRRRADAFYAFQRDLALALYEAGVPLLVGTDTPNPMLVPGFSVHLEIEALVEAGIPVLEVLRAATRNAARFLGDEGEWGVVAPGAAADLVLLEHDPLDDLAGLRTPAGVMVAGRWLDRETLDGMIEKR